MRLSASETWTFGPLKVTLSKTGVSLSLGIPGARVGINSKGQARVRFGKNGFSYNKSKKVLPGVDPMDLFQ